MNCPNCNAPVRSEYCEYCGTYFGMDLGKDEGTHAVVIPVNVSGEQVDEVIRGMDAFRQFHKAAYDVGVDIGGDNDEQN